VPKFDRAFAAIVEDLAVSGLLEHTLVVAMSEFGRTPRINGHVGRDHWPERGARDGRLRREAGRRRRRDKRQGHLCEGRRYDIGAVFHTWFTALGIDPKTVEYDNHGQRCRSRTKK